MIGIGNIVNISVTETPSGVGARNTSSIAVFTREASEASFGSEGFKIYRNLNGVGSDFDVSTNTYKMATAIFAQQPNILAAGGYLVVIKFDDSGASNETLTEALVRTMPLVEYFSVISQGSVSDAADAAATVQANDKILALISDREADLEAGGLFEGLTEEVVRPLYYGGLIADALVFAAAYLSRGLAVNFAAENSTLTMNLKQLRGVKVDDTVTQTILDKAKTLGADLYTNIETRPVVISHDANGYFDEVHNKLWLKQAVQRVYLNTLLQTTTKIPQTEEGMNLIKSNISDVLEQAVRNGYLAPGEWNSPDTFGSLNDFLRSIRDSGYYIYSQPLAEQSISDREARKAAILQIAVKAAGAVHTADIIININR